MNVAIRADASVDLGAGHVMRCLALAGELRRGGAAVRFVCRELPGHLCAVIESQGHAVARLPADIDAASDAEHCLAVLPPLDWLVVDHYGLDAAWESRLRDRARRILAIDDLADRRHDCDLLLDQNLVAADAYRERLPAACPTLLGPRHALLRPQFAECRATLAPRPGPPRRLLVFFGGGDAGGETLKALEALALLERPDLAADVVIGAAHPRRAEVEAACRALPNARLHCQVEDMAARMAASDLAIGAGGTASWERCCLGLPALVIGIAANQRGPAAVLAEAGAQLYLGESRQVDARRLASAIEQALALPELLRHLARRGRELVDGQGARRVARHLLADALQLRPAAAADSENLLIWRNHPDNRGPSFDARLISREEHENWLAGVLADPDRHLLIGEEAGRPLGVLRYDLTRDGWARASIYVVPGTGGRGHGGRLLLAGERWLKARHPAIAGVEAAILADNAASLGAFRAAGFFPHHLICRKPFHEPS